MIDGEASKSNSRQTDSEYDEEHGNNCGRDVASRNQTNSRKHESCNEQRSVSLHLEISVSRRCFETSRFRENLGRSRSRASTSRFTSSFSTTSPLKLARINRLSVAYSELHAVHAVFVSHAMHRLLKFMYYQALPLLSTYLLINLMPPTIMK